ncbi:hypothetical protein AAHA92_23949 [Salvia divinorum]|uniref:TF-B3 domain-containing protein n=1 Tax=Salvia divinorum TaxID=28513 RepID=A0ABD1GTJ5_SALDI
MMAHSKQDACPTVVKEEVLQANEESPQAGFIPSFAAAEVEIDDGFCCLSGDKPFFHVIMSNSHIHPPYNMKVPSHMVPICPRQVVPMILTHGSKNWNMSYNGKAKQHRFEAGGWRSFVADNKMELGDACIFEVMEPSMESFRLRVIILRNIEYLPPELEANVPDTQADGMTPESAIEID